MNKRLSEFIASGKKNLPQGAGLYRTPEYSMYCVFCTPPVTGTEIVYIYDTPTHLRISGVYACLQCASHLDPHSNIKMKRVEYWVYNKLENFNTASEDIDRYYLHNNLEDNAPCFICKELTDICAALEIPVNHDENFVGGEVGICQECAMSLCTEFHTSFPEYKELRDEYRHFLANQDASIKDLVAVTMKAWNDAHEIGKADCPVCSEEYSITFFEDEVRSKIDLPRVGRLCPWCTSQQKKAAPPQVVIQGEIKDSHGKLLNKIKRLIYKDCAVCQSSFAIDLCIKFADLERRHWINPNHIVCASCHFPNSNEYTRGSRLVAINDMEDPNQEKYQLRVYLHNDGTYTTIKKSQEATATTFHGKVSFTDAIIKSLTDGET